MQGSVQNHIRHPLEWSLEITYFNCACPISALAQIRETKAQEKDKNYLRLQIEVSYRLVTRVLFPAINLLLQLSNSTLGNPSSGSELRRECCGMDVTGVSGEDFLEEVQSTLSSLGSRLICILMCPLVTLFYGCVFFVFSSLVGNRVGLQLMSVAPLLPTNI